MNPPIRVVFHRALRHDRWWFSVGDKINVNRCKITTYGHRSICQRSSPTTASARGDRGSPAWGWRVNARLSRSTPGISRQKVQSYTEVESGKRKDRPQLTKAIGHAKLARATLVVAKLDRLARNVAFLSALMESEIDFVACDNPHANRPTIHILAAVAEDEVRRISERTKAALAAAKRRGIKLGSARPGHWNGREDRRFAAGIKGLRVGLARDLGVVS